MAQPEKKQDLQIAKLSPSGFLALPRDLVRLCWRHLRLKEIALLVALIDLADGRWSMPFALVELARLAHLSAGNARETAAHLERIGLISREQTAPGVYRWQLATDGYQQIAHELAHRPRMRAKPRPAQTTLPFEPAAPAPAMPSPAPRPRLALVLPPPPLAAALPVPSPAPAPLPPERAPSPPTFDPPGIPDTIPAPPPPPDTERIPDGDPYPYLPPCDLGPDTPSDLGLSLGRIVELAARPFGDDDAPPTPPPPPPPAPIQGVPIRGIPRPDSGRPPAPIQGAPRPDSGRPLLMISRPSPDPEQKPVNRSASAHAEGTTDGTGGEGFWAESERKGLVALAIELSGPDLHPAPVRLRLASLEALLTPAPLVEQFLREEIPAARHRGARFPFAAAFSRWPAWQEEQARKAAPPRPVLAPLASPPPIRQAGEGRRAPCVSEAQKNSNLEGARGVLAALRGAPAPRPGLSPAGGRKP